MSVLNWFLTGSDQPRITDRTVIKKEYKKHRIEDIASIIFGYGMYYVVKLPLSVAKKPLLAEGMTATQLGMIGAALTIAYAFGKCFNGFMGDRCNIKKIVPLGLLGAAIMNIIFGFSSINFTLFFFLWLMNGFFSPWAPLRGRCPCRSGSANANWQPGTGFAESPTIWAKDLHMSVRQPSWHALAGEAASLHPASSVFWSRC